MITTIYRVNVIIPDDVAEGITKHSLETVFDSMYLFATECSEHAETCSYGEVVVTAEFFNKHYANSCEIKLSQMIRELRVLIAEKEKEYETNPH